MTTIRELTLAVSAALALTACAEVMEGDWQSKTGHCADGVTDTFTVGSDMTGDGTFVVGCLGEDGPAVPCTAWLSTNETIESRWTLEAVFQPSEDQSVCATLGRRFKECDVRSDGDELRCCDPDGQRCVEYTRTD
ncbi:MAG: hypothetical protein JRI23_34955 [Deltaproteobacteria bacterium]|jgi:hypothetical protein|nr:hypothetical protein [Deltaproteobacteria bacterium]MBW2537507.1 hypothetical protein [Deltaproteobacteria bacterium]